ncbi:hypothetical protein [Endothiovibrio diazotrophicus]
MKTAISIPDPLFQAAEEFAHARGLTRSQLYARAMSEYLEGHRDDRVTERLDYVYGAAGADSSVEPELEEMQRRSIPQDGESW